MAIYDNRICCVCGRTFSGGPRSWYCPECREDRRREREKKYRSGPAKRPLGSYDICENCGEQYIVASGLQKYCPACQQKMHKKIDNEQGIAYYHERIDKTERALKRRKRHSEHRDEDNLNRRIKYAQNANAEQARQKKYREKNPQKVKVWNKTYYDKHAEAKREYARQYRQRMKEQKKDGS